MLWAAGLIVVIGAVSGLITPLVAASLQERTPKDRWSRFGLFNAGHDGLLDIGIHVRPAGSPTPLARASLLRSVS